MSPAEELLGAVARGWCHPKNENKVFDPDLAIAIAAEVDKVRPAPSEAPREVWIPVSERLPEPLSTVVYWDQMAGFSVADEWDNEHHLPGATHWLNVSAPSRSEGKS